ncbi:Tetracycline resistance protein from transposon [Tolypocladium paradoxum]|uniref:Tetracycline resistance protein from transposon n=1 Tax=Tolypocladium paradoxum TaxID=94208 RepID=A0A2S4KSU4_9HYPO|nr:Tetracycline resistance protein from transposon [Tolypocladium paradoxum]
MSPSQPRTAIIGGSPARLTVSLLLHRRSIPFTIFELRQKPTDEELAKPWGMLDLHEESGLAAIRECGLYDQFLQLTGEYAETQKVSDKDGNILYMDEGEMSQRPEISRHALTKLLSSHLPAETIKWGHKLPSAASSATPSGTETELDFGPHGKPALDLVVGADGAWSQVRSLLTDVTPHYSGTQSITATVRQVTAKYPHLAALGLRHGVMSQRGPQDSARVCVLLTTADEGFAASSGLAGRTAAAAKDRLLDDDALLGRWGPAVKELVTVACDEESADNPGAAVDIKPLYTLPIGTSWEHKPGATLIGDAAHLMCPWASEGVNMAMWDSLWLARAITRARQAAGQDAASFQSVLDPLMKEFEEDLVARAKDKAEETYSNSQMLFGEDGAKAFAEFFLGAYRHLVGAQGGGDAIVCDWLICPVRKAAPFVFVTSPPRIMSVSIKEVARERRRTRLVALASIIVSRDRPPRPPAPRDCQLSRYGMSPLDDLFPSVRERSTPQRSRKHGQSRDSDSHGLLLHSLFAHAEQVHPDDGTEVWYADTGSQVYIIPSHSMRSNSFYRESSISAAIGR